MTTAPKHRTNQPSRRVALYLPPYQEEWLRERAAAAFPEDGPRTATSRYLRSLVERAMDEEKNR